VSVDGSDNKYAVSIANKIGEKDVKLTLTGVSQRKKAWFKVYTIGSYVEEGADVHSAAELASKDCAKQMHLIMERNVDGKTMAEAFVEGIRLNHPEPQFNDSCDALLGFMKGANLKEGDNVWLTHIPGVGFNCRLPNGEAVIKDVAFATAIWEIYLGDNNIGDGIKKGLTSRLK
jgi:hypothetical protein